MWTRAHAWKEEAHRGLGAHPLSPCSRAARSARPGVPGPGLVPTASERVPTPSPGTVLEWSHSGSTCLGGTTGPHRPGMKASESLKLKVTGHSGPAPSWPPEPGPQQGVLAKE